MYHVAVSGPSLSQLAKRVIEALKALSRRKNGQLAPIIVDPERHSRRRPRVEKKAFKFQFALLSTKSMWLAAGGEAAAIKMPSKTNAPQCATSATNKEDGRHRKKFRER